MRTGIAERGATAGADAAGAGSVVRRDEVGCGRALGRRATGFLGEVGTATEALGAGSDVGRGMRLLRTGARRREVGGWFGAALATWTALGAGAGAGTATGAFTSFFCACFVSFISFRNISSASLSRSVDVGFRGIAGARAATLGLGAGVM